MNQKLYLPFEIEEALDENFSFPKQPLFGSVATMNDQHPRVRTMRIYAFNREGSLILLTDVRSNKWKEFATNPRVAISFLNDNKLFQVIVHGSVHLFTAESFEQANEYWNMMRTDVKKSYDLAHIPEVLYHESHHLSATNEAPTTFGIVQVVPSFWEVLDLDREYTDCFRYQFHLNGNVWQKLRVNVG